MAFGVFWKIAGVVFLAWFSQLAFRIYTTWGGCVHNHSHHPGPCTKVKGIQPGSEDFYTLPSGLTFVTSGIRYEFQSEASKAFWKSHDIRGRIYVLDLNDVTVCAKELKVTSTATFDADSFVPHGVSVWEDKEKGRHILFVVNHPYGTKTDRVEQFVYHPGNQSLTHHGFFTHPTMTIVNDVQVTGPDSFYFTNCNYFRSHPLLAAMELLLSLKLNTVVHCDNHTSCYRVDGGLGSPNGVAMSNDGKHVYVADMEAQSLFVYKRHENNSLSRLQDYRVYTWADNIQVDAQSGDLYIAAHPDAFTFVAYTEDLGNKKSPSQVLRLKVSKETGLITSSQELLYDNGDLISGASVALVRNDCTLLIGSVYDSLVTCQVNVPLL